MRLWVLGLWAMVSIGACSSSTTNEGTTGGTGGAAGTGGSGGTSTGGAPTGGSAGSGGSPVGGASGSGGGAPDGGPQCPPGMVSVGDAFCIDKTEVTTGSYAQFLSSHSPDAGNITGNSGCTGVTDYAPATGADCPVAPYTTDLQLPVRCVDWCSAYAYCKWAEKRLCGAIPEDPVDPSQYAEKGKDQWYTACIGTGSPEDEYFYGSSFDEKVCQTSAASVKGPVNVGSKLDCKSHWFAGLVDMTGNVAEWEDSCDSASSPTALCLVRGGSHADGTSEPLSCSGLQKHERTAQLPTVGFRCCWDPSVK